MTMNDLLNQAKAENAQLRARVEELEQLVAILNSMLPALDLCQHEWVARWDHLECKICQAVEIGNSPGERDDYGIAAGKTFASMEEAMFYKINGRLPE